MPQNKQKGKDAGEENQLPGWPGYRTRSGRSGLDPLDTRNEAAHMEGLFLRNVFTLRARTRNPFYLLLMFVLGVIPFVLIAALLIGGMVRLSELSLGTILYFVFFLLIAGALTINFLLSLLEILGVLAPLQKAGSARARLRKKKLPKRRKDYQ
jgi:hypothetical protein